MRTLLALLLASCILPLSVQANPADLFELDPLGKATAGASSATFPLLWSAAVHNPAALGRARKITLGTSYSYGYMGLVVNGQDANVLDYHGFDLGVAVPLPRLFGLKSALGITTHLPDQMVVRVQGIPSSEPRFIMYDNYPHRLQMGIGLGVELTPLVHLGFGASVMMDLLARSIHLNVGTKGGQKIGEMELDAALPYRVVPYGGVILNLDPLGRALKGTKVSLFYREPYSFRLKMNIISDVDVAGIVTGDAIIALKMYDHYTPRKVTLGVGYNTEGSVSLFAALDWMQWSKFNAGISLVKILVDLGVNPPLVEAFLPPDNFHDTLSPKVGVKFSAGDLAFQGGYAYVPSPAPRQTGLSTLMDNDRHVVAAGLSYRFEGPSVLPYPAMLHLSYQFHGLVPKTATKENPTLPSVQHGGTIHQLSLGLQMEF